MFAFHEGKTRQPHEILVFTKDGEPINVKQRDRLLRILNRMAGFDDDPLWDDPCSGSRLRVADMLENHSEPNDVTETLRKLGGAVIRSLVRELDEQKQVL